MLPIIDTHQHLWDLNRFELPWLADVPSLQRSFLTSDYLDATAGLNVVKAVYMEVDVAPEQQTAEARHLLQLCAQPDTPTVGAVISGRPASPDFAEYIRPLAAFPAIKGVRQVLHVPDAPPGLCLEPQYVASVQLLGELGLRFDLCMRPAELSDGAKLAAQCPDTRFVVDHCGNGDPYIISGADEGTPGDPFWHERQQWMDGISALAEQPNTICKISGIIARTRPGWTADSLAPAVNHCLDSFGPDRVVFGGDWPVCTLGAGTSYRAWVEALREIIADRREAEQRKLLAENAEQFYAL